MAVAGLDMTETNPWSRLTNSEHTSLHGLKEWVRRYIRGLRGLPRGMPNRAQVAARQVNKETRQAQGLVSLILFIYVNHVISSSFICQEDFTNPAFRHSYFCKQKTSGWPLP